MTSSTAAVMDEYIRKHHREEIEHILKSGKSVIAVNFDLTVLFNEHEKFFKQMRYYYEEEHVKWKKAVLNQVSEILQSENIQLSREKLVIDIEYHNHPHKIDWPRINTDVHQLVEFKGYVFRASSPRKLELIREVACTKCKRKTTIKADRIFGYAFKCSRKCTIQEDCEGKMVFTKKEEEIPPLENTTDFQIYKVQELDKFTPKNRFLEVEVEGKLVGSCSIGDTVVILGIFETRCDPQTYQPKRVVIHALTISKMFEFKHSINSNEREATYAEWIALKKQSNNDELQARDEMLKAVAPELTNCAILKLALMVTLCTGSRTKSKNRSEQIANMKNREISHLLLIGLPGLGKSQLLKAASKISNRAVKVIGSACTMAGLTASSYKEDKETHVEAGALVLANHGICCIDEFNLLSTRNRGALHDAMEHQKFSFMQANLKIEVNTRCNIIASMNHKAEQTAEARNKNIKNAPFNIEPSLISRFDLVFFLEKVEDPEFDENIINSIISEAMTGYKEVETSYNLEKIQLHVIGAKSLACELTPEVMQLIINYYRFCMACEGVDESRKTMRLLKSLERLTIGHAKLLLRSKTKLIDALTVIWLMENSWSFGDLVSQQCAVTSELPVGPSDKCIRHIFDTLLLSEMYSKFESEQSEAANDTFSAVTFLKSKHDIVKKVEVKKLFNKTKKGKSNENTEEPRMDMELPPDLQKSFALKSIDDLFEDSDDEVNLPTVASRCDTLSLAGIEDYFLNDNDTEVNESINPFVIQSENMSTQMDQPSTSKGVFTQQQPKEVTQKKSLANLFMRKSKEPAEDGKRRRLSSDDDLFNVFSDEFLSEKKENKKEEAPKVAATAPQENLSAKKSFGFFNRLQAFEYASQSGESSKQSEAPKEPASLNISENLQALSNQLAGTSNKISTEKPSMTGDELLAALEAEMDLWN